MELCRIRKRGSVSSEAKDLSREMLRAACHQIDIGRRLPVFPVTPPYVRVRIRRFGGLSYRVPNSWGIPSEEK